MMNKQIGESWQVILDPLSEPNDALSDFLDSFFEVTACNYIDDELEQYVGYSSTRPDTALMESSAAVMGLTLPVYTVEFIPPVNWLAKNIIAFDPIEIDKLLIYGAHEEKIPQTDKPSLQIYAATAFGSGQHQTTKMCLKALSGLDKKAKILDMGCGSGILALAAAKLWQKAKVFAADIDDEAVVVSLKNAADNNLEITVWQSDGYQNPQIAANAPYDLILSNILARPLIDMAPDLAKNLTSSGTAILSGFTADQTDWVVAAHRTQGLQLKKTLEEDNWRAVIMEKSDDS